MQTDAAVNSAEGFANPTAAEQTTPHSDLAAIAPGEFKVIRRNGKVTGFDPNKIAVALT